MNKKLWAGIKEALAPQAHLLTQTDQFVQKAAVMVLITDEPEPQIVYTLRAKHLTYHAGEVCFPGGMWELQDNTLLASAMRETHEEIGLASSALEVLGAFSSRRTRTGTEVTPYVARIPANCQFILNHQELDVAFTVPVKQFAEGLQIRLDVFEHRNQKYEIPAYSYQGYEIWGFTSAVTTELLGILHPLMNTETEKNKK